MAARSRFKRLARELERNQERYVRTAPKTDRREKIGDDALLFIIKTFSYADSTQVIVDAIRARGYQASLPRVDALIAQYRPFENTVAPGLKIVKTATVTQLPVKEKVS